MSRIGKRSLTIPSGVTLSLQDGMIVVKGPQGELKESMQPGITVTVDGTTVQVSRTNDLQQTRAHHGLVRSLIANMLKGVTEGYEVKLEMVGTGYRAALQGQKLVLSVGFSHPIEVVQPAGVTFAVDGNTKISIKGISKHDVGQVAANIRKIRPPEPYKGKGIKYENEVVRRKAGKAVKAAGAA